eukprot:353295-Chlamydomonas_euryale.AAC.1
MSIHTCERRPLVWPARGARMLRPPATRTPARCGATSMPSPCGLAVAAAPYSSRCSPAGLPMLPAHLQATACIAKPAGMGRAPLVRMHNRPCSGCHGGLASAATRACMHTPVRRGGAAPPPGCPPRKEQTCPLHGRPVRCAALPGAAAGGAEDSGGGNGDGGSSGGLAPVVPRSDARWQAPGWLQFMVIFSVMAALAHGIPSLASPTGPPAAQV